MLRDNLCYSDPFLCLLDFESYSDCQKRVDPAFRDKSRWPKMAILNKARMKKFSSDRTIKEYARDAGRSSRSLFDGRVVFLLRAARVAISVTEIRGFRRMRTRFAPSVARQRNQSSLLAGESVYRNSMAG